MSPVSPHTHAGSLPEGHEGTEAAPHWLLTVPCGETAPQPQPRRPRALLLHHPGDRDRISPGTPRAPQTPRPLWFPHLKSSRRSGQAFTSSEGSGASRLAQARADRDVMEPPAWTSTREALVSRPGWKNRGLAARSHPRVSPRSPPYQCRGRRGTRTQSRSHRQPRGPGQGRRSKVPGPAQGAARPRRAPPSPWRCSPRAPCAGHCPPEDRAQLGTQDRVLWGLPKGWDGAACAQGTPRGILGEI